MFRITEQENKQIRKMYGLISESTESDCNNNQIEFKEFRVWCAMGKRCTNSGYKIKPVVSGQPDNICADKELIRAYSDTKLYDEFKIYMGR
jgi:hypothetical protein